MRTFFSQVDLQKQQYHILLYLQLTRKTINYRFQGHLWIPQNTFTVTVNPGKKT